MIKLFLGLSLMLSFVSAKVDNNVTKRIENNETKKVQELKSSCKDANSTACFLVGMAYAKGEDVAKDADKSFEFFHKSCDLNATTICVRLANTYENRESVRYDVNRSIELYEKACKLKEARACDALGYLYTGANIDVKEDENLSAHYFMQTCKIAGYTCEKIAVAYETGAGLKQNRTFATKFHEKACDNNSTRSCSELGRYYVEQSNFTKAQRVLTKACSLKSGWSCGELGRLHEEGNSEIKKDLVKSIKFHKMACSANHRTSCSRVGMYYLSEKKMNDSLEYLTKACNMADAVACREIALIYRDGKESVEKDKFKSVKFFAQACQYGDEESCR